VVVFFMLRITNDRTIMGKYVSGPLFNIRAWTGAAVVAVVSTMMVVLKLINDKRLMGKFVNGRVFNIISWAMVVVLIVLTVILVVTSVFPGLLGGG